MKRNSFLAETLVLAAILVLFAPASAAQPTVTLINVKKIWDEAPHSAFTDLAHWHGRFLCAFREGRNHVSSDGRIRVLTSPDGNEWSSVAVVALDGFDLRDAGLSTMPDGRLMLIGGAAPRETDNENAPTGSFVAFSNDARTWTKPEIVIPPGRWLWRITWHDGTAYGIAYAAPNRHPFSTLLATKDGRTYSAVVPELLGDGYPTEATIRFGQTGTLYCLQRRDGAAPKHSAMLGVSRSPYTAWQWHDLGLHFGGPNFIELPTGHFVAVGRVIQPGGPKTTLAWLDVNKKKLTPVLELPSGGDTSYPGLVWHDDKLWVSYYSGHEAKANIYLATVKIN